MNLKSKTKKEFSKKYVFFLKKIENLTCDFTEINFTNFSIVFQVDDELENLSFDDDEDDASLVVSNHVHEEQQLYVAQPQAESTPYVSGMMNPNQQLEQEFLYRQQPGIIALLKYFVKLFSFIF